MAKATARKLTDRQAYEVWLVDTPTGRDVLLGFLFYHDGLWSSYRMVNRRDLVLCAGEVRSKAAAIDAVYAARPEAGGLPCAS